MGRASISTLLHVHVRYGSETFLNKRRRGGGGGISPVSPAIGSPNILHSVADSGNKTHDPRTYDGVPGSISRYISPLPTDRVIPRIEIVSLKESLEGVG